MPSIAQQDYFKIVMKNTGYYPDLAKIKHCIERNTIFDATIEIPDSEHQGVVSVMRPLMIASINAETGTPRAWVVGYSNGHSLSNFYIENYTQAQFEGLGAIQDAIDDYDIVSLGALTYEGDSYLIGAGNIICVAGKMVKVTVEQGVLVKVEQTENTPPQDLGVNAIDIAWDDVQKLIGLFCEPFEP